MLKWPLPLTKMAAITYRMIKRVSANFEYKMFSNISFKFKYYLSFNLIHNKLYKVLNLIDGLVYYFTLKQVITWENITNSKLSYMSVCSTKKYSRIILPEQTFFTGHCLVVHHEFHITPKTSGKF